ncbi:hypothetical protein EXIGLDRAFT_155240 [Exidia glandulosa HHB12029]|uniref:Uncharacterized protein n=1 Tax=Exidia glandulosa HHB12029 TaxID=1314781 RepID=A0A165QIF8_EXIGL|nr:hypothetical protein EXIGLDRAFT_155240 [Exidia glandulosa HHB12029]
MTLLVLYRHMYAMETLRVFLMPSASSSSAVTWPTSLHFRRSAPRATRSTASARSTTRPMVTPPRERSGTPSPTVTATSTRRRSPSSSEALCNTFATARRRRTSTSTTPLPCRRA